MQLTLVLRMPKPLLPLLALVFGWANLNADALPRSRTARTDFQRTHPCPATGAQRGACRGYVIDHIMPLCAGGEDAPSNMQWQTVDDGKIKDAHERRLCRNLKR